MDEREFRGSQWLKWDLHVHSPATFGGEFGRFIENLNLSEADVIGINDYCTIRGFSEVASGKHGDCQKVIFPVIELRMRNMVLDKADPRLQAGVRINFHIIFDNDPALVPRIATWLNSLDCLREGGTKDKLGNTEDSEERSQLSFDYHEVIAALKSDSALRDRSLVWLPYNEYGGVDNIDPETDGYFKLGLINEAHVIGSARKKQIDFFLWKDPKHSADRIRAWLNGRQFPCLKGSDAHKIDYPFGRLQDSNSQPTNRFCWIKAEPTLEGLRQILFEPEGRVFIGEASPASFDHTVVDSFSVSIENSGFFLRNVGKFNLSPGLNCVIGSRGSGKSTFLDAIALSLGDKAVLEANRNNYVGSFFGKNDPSILSGQVRHSSSEKPTTVSPSDAGPRGFVFDYYHQKRIGELADPRNETILSRFLFSKIFRSDRELVEVFDVLEQGRSTCASDLAINREQVVGCIQEIMKGEEISRRIAECNSRVSFLSKKAIQHLLEERGRVIVLQQKMDSIRTRLALVEEDPLVKDAASVDRDFFSQVVLSDLDPDGTLLPKEWKKLEDDAKEFLAALDSDKAEIQGKVDAFTARLTELESGTDFEKQLESIWEKIQAEAKSLNLTISKKDLDALDSIQKEIANLTGQLEKIEKRKSEMADLLKARQKLLTDYAGSLKSVTEQVLASFKRLLDGNGAVLRGTVNLELSTILSMEECLKCVQDCSKHGLESGSPSFPNRKSLLQLFEALGHTAIIDAFRQGAFANWDASGLGPQSRKYFVEIQNREEVALRLEEILPELTSRLLWRSDSTRDFKPLRSCSIGERGTALLSVILVSGDEPLVIDQPEDDLDHFYLYTTLTPIIKEVKTRRQLIFATHDANIVINGDAELIVLIQTEDGVTCSIEPTTIENLATRKRILEILEGGGDAFRQRQRKYGSAGL